LRFDRARPGPSDQVRFDGRVEIGKTAALALPHRSVDGAGIAGGGVTSDPWQAARKAVEMWKTELSANCGFSFFQELAGRPEAL
jgi:hypothetical protein